MRKIEVNLFFIRFHFLLSYSRPTRHWASEMMKGQVHAHCLSLMHCEASSASPSEYIGCKLVSHLPRLAAVPLLLTILMALFSPILPYFALFYPILPYLAAPSPSLQAKCFGIISQEVLCTRVLKVTIRKSPPPKNNTGRPRC